MLVITFRILRLLVNQQVNFFYLNKFSIKLFCIIFIVMQSTAGKKKLSTKQKNRKKIHLQKVYTKKFYQITKFCIELNHPIEKYKSATLNLKTKKGKPRKNIKPEKNYFAY